MHPATAEPAPHIPRRRRWAAGFGWVLLVPTLLVLGARLAGFSVGTPWVQLLSLTPLFTIPALVALVLFAVARSRIPAMVAAGAALSLAVLLVAPFAPHPAGRATIAGSQARTAPGLRMMSLNAGLGAALTTAGIDELLPHTVQVPEGGAAGAGTYSRFPLKARDIPQLGAMAFGNPTTSFTVFGSDGRDRRVEITNVHTFPPLPDAVDSWRHDVGALAHVNSEGGTRILAGDFNASYDHREFRDLLRANPAAPLANASTGGLARLQPTWPRDMQYSPGIVIDHVLTSADVSTCGYQTRRIPGTDHAAVLVTLDFT